jgi:hypothetical protein
MSSPFPSSSAQYTELRVGQYDTVQLAKAVTAAIELRAETGQGDIPGELSDRDEARNPTQSANAPSSSSTQLELGPPTGSLHFLEFPPSYSQPAVLSQPTRADAPILADA